MNIQQLRYVVAIANSGTFREAAEKMYVSQPSLSISIRDLEKEIGFQIFNRTSSGTFLTKEGMEFYEKAQTLVKGFDQFEHLYLQSEEGEKVFSISSQHYDFLPPLITEFSRRHLQYPHFRLFESTTVQILDEVARGYSELGIIYLNERNTKGIMQKLDKLHLQVEDLADFQTHIYLREDHPLTRKAEIESADLVGLPTVRFTQEKEAYLYYSENLIDTSGSSVVFDVTDRATLNGILERTDAYATGSGFLDDESVNGITVIPFKEKGNNRMVYVRRANDELTPCAKDFVRAMKEYFNKKKEENA
ncbi:LysR family transcriptional regulator [Streptococcus suis]|nr:LysR family transcriptional regulator [Streptococcus suis]